MILPGFPNLLMRSTAAGGSSSSPLALVSATMTTSESAVYAPSGVLDGYLIVLIRLTHDDDPADLTIYDPTGFTLAASAQSGPADEPTMSGRLLYRFAEADAETVDLSLAGFATARTWVYVFSGARASDPIGDTDSATATDRAATFDALTIVNSRSFVVGAVIVREADQTTDTLGGATTTVGVGTGYYGFYVGPVASFSQCSVTIETSISGSGAPGDPFVYDKKRYLTMNAEIVSEV